MENEVISLSKANIKGFYSVAEIEAAYTKFGPTNILTCDYYSEIYYYCDFHGKDEIKRRGIRFGANPKLNEAVKKAEKLNKDIDFRVEDVFTTKYGTKSVKIDIKLAA
jgi:hypothetical protein